MEYYELTALHMCSCVWLLTVRINLAKRFCSQVALKRILDQREALKDEKSSGKSQNTIYYSRVLIISYQPILTTDLVLE